MNQSTLEILIKIKDEASAGIAELSKKTNALGDSFKLTATKGIGLGTDVTGLAKTLAGLTVAAGGVAIAFGIASVKAYEDAQVAIARVDATLETMGKTAVANRSAILSAADAAVRLGFDDEDAAESITRFYQATGNLTQAQKLNNIAMDLARAKHLDLATAANLVNQVLSGNGRVLKQYQINLKDSATPLEALGELQGKVAGQAAAFSQTFQGEMQVLAVNFQNIKETIGQVLVEALTPFIQQFTNWLNDPKTRQQFQQWTTDFKSWAEVIIPVLVETFKTWLGVLQDIFNIIVKIGDGITTMVNKASEITQGSSNPFEAIGRLGGAVGAAGLNAAGSFISSLNLTARASGGPVTAGSPYMTGENGPELFVPSTNGSIIPNGRSGGGNISVSFSGNFYGTDQSAAERMADQVAKILGQQVKIRTI